MSWFVEETESVQTTTEEPLAELALAAFEALPRCVVLMGVGNWTPRVINWRPSSISRLRRLRVRLRRRSDRLLNNISRVPFAEVIHELSHLSRHDSGLYKGTQ